MTLNSFIWRHVHSRFFSGWGQDSPKCARNIQSPRQLVFYQWRDDPACSAFRSFIPGITMALRNGTPSAYWEKQNHSYFVYLLRSKLRIRSVFSSSSMINIRCFFQDLSKSCQSRVLLPLNVYFQSSFIFLVQFS